MVMGVYCLSSPLCPRVFYYDYKAKRQQRKWDKENLWIPKHSKATMMRRHLSEHWVATSWSSNPTPRILLCTMVRSQASCWAVDGDGDLELSCPRACYLHLAFLLPLSLASLIFSSTSSMSFCSSRFQIPSIAILMRLHGDSIFLILL